MSTIKTRKTRLDAVRHLMQENVKKDSHTNNHSHVYEDDIELSFCIHGFGCISIDKKSFKVENTLPNGSNKFRCELEDLLKRDLLVAVRLTGTARDTSYAVPSYNFTLAEEDEKEGNVTLLTNHHAGDGANRVISIVCKYQDRKSVATKWWNTNLW